MRVTIFKNGEKPRFINVASYDHALFELAKEKNDFDVAIYTGSVNEGKNLIHEEIRGDDISNFKQSRQGN